MKTIYILLTRSTTILSRLVHFVTEDTYTHAALAFDEELKHCTVLQEKMVRHYFRRVPV